MGKVAQTTKVFHSGDWQELLHLKCIVGWDGEIIAPRHQNHIGSQLSEVAHQRTEVPVGHHAERSSNVARAAHELPILSNAGSIDLRTGSINQAFDCGSIAGAPR